MKISFLDIMCVASLTCSFLIVDEARSAEKFVYSEDPTDDLTDSNVAVDQVEFSGSKKASDIIQLQRFTNGKDAMNLQSLVILNAGDSNALVDVFGARLYKK
ncbi:MAG: hypothetical protein LBJ77_00960 [Holosporales bacterium]|nr:hypothetical protein [Holosporales bacterium]